MTVSRREALAAMAAVPVAAAAGPLAAYAADDSAMRRIPSSGALIPAVGLGTWITFNVGSDPELLARSTDVARAFFQEGGGMIDSSPMYGSSQDTIGHALEALGRPDTVFSAEKVWTRSGEEGPAQIAATRTKWGVPRFDLMQVHNLVAVERHLETLFAMKQAGDLGYVGVSTSHGRRHRDLERLIDRAGLDFVQLTYNVVDREAEARLLPLARERGVAVIVNRPYQRGALIRRFASKPLPAWAGDIGARSWAQFLLKFVLSHPAVTVAIPATTRVDHVRENKASARGVLPDARTRRRMADYVRDL